jgi:glycosyltransferase involved in cell wall biosynthesis
MPSVCIVHNNVDDASSIGKIAKWAAAQALDAGWDVFVVARDLDASLVGRVEHLPLHIPAHAHAIQWLAARRTVRTAIGHRTFDVVHVHQPQLVSMADVMQCHFLLRSAKAHGGFGRPRSLRHAVTQVQQRFVLSAEERCIRRWPPRAVVLFDSELLSEEFRRWYGPRRNNQVLLYPAPPYAPVGSEERVAARIRLTGDSRTDEVVVGYLGGIDTRKGHDRLTASLRSMAGAFLLGAGPGSDGWYRGSATSRRERWIGQTNDVPGLLAACDVLVVPSRFEPFGLVCFEAAARGVPVITATSVGALATLEHYGAGREWRDGEPLEPLLRWAVEDRPHIEDAARKMVEYFRAEEQGRRLLEVYNNVIRQRNVHLE